MKITVENALTFGGLVDGKIVAGAQGIDNIIDSVTVLEVADPYARAWNLPNQLHVTAFYAIRDDKAAQLAVIRSLKEGGCSGVVLCHLGDFMERIEPDVIALCDALGFPLILVPRTVTYIEIIVPIVNRILEISNEKNRLALEMQESLLQKVVNEEGLDSICRFLGERLAAAIVIIDVMDKVVASYGCSPDEIDLIYGELRQSREQILTNNTYVTIRPAKEYYVYPIVNEDERYGYLVCEINSLDLEYVLLMLKHAAVASSLLVTHHQRRSRMQQLYINELIRDMVEDKEKNWDDLQRIASGVNWNLDSIKGLLVMEAATNEVPDMLWSVDHIFIQNNITRQFGVIRGQFILFLDGSADGRGTADLLLKNLLKHHQTLRRYDIALSVSNPINDRQSIPEAYRITRDTLALGRRFLPDTDIYECKNLAFLPYLYENALNTRYRTIATDVLAPLTEYDRKHNHDLVRSFEALLMSDQNLQQIADSLFVHRNTLQYRKNKIVELLNEDPFAGLNRMNYLLALFIRKF